MNFINDMEYYDSNYCLKELRNSDFMDLVNNFDESTIGNKNGSLKCDSEQLYSLLLFNDCYAGTQKQKQKYLKDRSKSFKNPWIRQMWEPKIHWRSLSKLFNCEEEDVPHYIRYMDIDITNIKNIKEINLTNVKNARNKKFFSEYLAYSSFLYLISVILDNNIKRFVASDYGYSITTVDQLTYEDLEDWMKTFGLTKDKVHIQDKRIWIDSRDFPKAG